MQLMPHPRSPRLSESLLQITFGPIRYLLQAHDEWGVGTLTRLEQNLECIGFASSPDRVIHLCELTLEAHEAMQPHSFTLPVRLGQLADADLPPTEWHKKGDDCGHICWSHAKTHHALWTFNTETPHYQASFQLPWMLLFFDIMKRGGSIMHSGLVHLSGKGYLITAPPGGGKTTAITRLPAPWEVFADDAVLLWKNEEGGYSASPLPTWSFLLQFSEPPVGIGSWKIASLIRIHQLIHLQKALHEKLLQRRPIEMVSQTYRALSEHPQMIKNRDPYRGYLMSLAYDLQKTVPAWVLELTRSSEYWRLLN